jgi:hypothetical protein
MENKYIGNVEVDYNFGIIDLREVFDLVSQGIISEEDFQRITRYNYEGIKISRGWN